MQTINLGFLKTKTDAGSEKKIKFYSKIIVTYNVEVGAGTYTPPGKKEPVRDDKFDIVEPKHRGPITGKINWTGATLKYQMRFEVPSSGKVIASGPWDKLKKPDKNP